MENNFITDNLKRLESLEISTPVHKEQLMRYLVEKHSNRRSFLDKLIGKVNKLSVQKVLSFGNYRQKEVYSHNLIFQPTVNFISPDQYIIGTDSTNFLNQDY